jgi:hypothetical protein
MTVGLIGLSLLFAFATIVTISRGAWIAAAVVVVICGLMFHRIRLAFLCLALVGVFLAGVPPFNSSITSVLNRDDSSAMGHLVAIGRDVDTALTHIFGLGLGGVDRTVSLQAVPTPQPVQTGGATGGATVSGGSDESAGIGENLYLSVLVATGPLGAVTFTAWCLAVTLMLLRAAKQSASKWLIAGVAVAMVGSLVSAMSSSGLMRFTTAASDWLLLGLATGLVLAVSPNITVLDRQVFHAPRRLSRLLRRAPAQD